MSHATLVIRLSLTAALALAISACGAAPRTGVAAYDVVISNGRVIDPESATDRLLTIGITDGVVRYLGHEPAQGRQTIDASGLVVSPGFIDTDVYAHLTRWSVRDGVTSALDLRSGTADVDKWYREQAGKMLINVGVGVGYTHVRENVMGTAGRLDQERLQPASKPERADIVGQIRRGLDGGAVAIGLGASERWGLPAQELHDALAISAEYNAHLVATIRDVIWKSTDVPSILDDIINAARITHAAVHIPHLTSNGGPHVPRLLAMIDDARGSGVQVTAEDSPYREAMIEVGPGDVGLSDDELQELEALATGERLNRRTVARHAAAGTEAIAHNSWIEPFVLQVIKHPAVSIASHGYVDDAGRGFPRTAGAFSRLLSRYVRDVKAISLNEAIRKITLLPAQRLQSRVPAMQNKGRIRVGADADMVVFDPDRIRDRATLKEPTLAPEGIAYVLVNGVVVVNNGAMVTDVHPGRPIRASH